MKTRELAITFKGQNYKVWFEDVTPERAEALLASNGDRNRKRRPGRVDRYAADMTSGHWRITGETIRLDVDGNLLNGQHRLAAVVAAGVPVDMMFVSGINMDTMFVQDTGLPTGNDDWMPLEHASSSVCLIRAILSVFDHDLYRTASRDELVTLNDLIGAEHVKWAIETSRQSITRRAPVRAAMALIHKVNAARASVFVERLNTHDLPGGTIESLLHRAFTAPYKKRNHHDECSIAMRSVVATLRDEKITRLFGIGDEDLAWLVKTAGLEKLSTIRPEK